MAEERFTSKYDGTTQDNLLGFAENAKKATTVEGAETVNVQGFTLPRISDISGFVAVNNAGNAIGFMSKDQVASVLGELIGLNDSWFRNRGDVEDYDKTITPGLYRINNYGGENNPNIDFGFLLVYEINGYVLQNAYSLWANRTMTRSRTETGNWTEWQSL